MSDQQNEVWPTEAMFAAGDRAIAYERTANGQDATARGIWHAMQAADLKPWVDHRIAFRWRYAQPQGDWHDREIDEADLRIASEKGYAIEVQSRLPEDDRLAALLTAIDKLVEAKSGTADEVRALAALMTLRHGWE